MLIATRICVAIWRGLDAEDVSVVNAVGLSVDSASSLRVYYFFVVDSVCLSVCMSVCYAASSNRFFFFVSRWNQAIFTVISPCGTLQNVVLRFLIRPPNAQNLLPKFGTVDH